VLFGPIEVTSGRGGVVSRRSARGSRIERPCLRSVTRKRYEPSRTRRPAESTPRQRTRRLRYLGSERSLTSVSTTSPSDATTLTVTSSARLSRKAARQPS